MFLNWKFVIVGGVILIKGVVILLVIVLLLFVEVGRVCDGCVF